MNILFVCSAKTWGGNEKWSAMAMKTLSEKHTVYFFGRKKDLGDSFGADFTKDFAPMFATWDLYSFYKAWKFVRKNQVDCIVSTKKKEYFIFGLISRMLKIKHLIRLGIVRDMKRPIWHNLIYNKLNDGIIANAHRIENHLRQTRFMQKKPVFVLYNAVPGLRKIVEMPRTLTSNFHVVSTGMLTKRKGFHILIEAISALPSHLKESLQVTFIGEGRERENLENQVKKEGLQHQITFAGFQKNPLNILASANLFVLLSENEGISNALLEAIALGIPILTTDSGGSTEFIKHEKNGYIVPRNVESTKIYLEKILETESNQLMNIGLEGQQTVLELFSEDRFREEIHQLFDQL